MTEQIDFIKVKKDLNGNSRIVCHFLNFLPDWNKFHYSERYNMALQRAKKLGGKKYNTKKYGGGIVFNGFYSFESLQKSIENLLSEIGE